MSYSVAAPAFLAFTFLVLVLRGLLEALNGSAGRIVGSIFAVALGEFSVYVCKTCSYTVLNILLTSDCFEGVFCGYLQTLVPSFGQVPRTDPG